MNEAMLGELIPILVSIAMFALIFGIVYLGNREKMAMIERGMDPRIAKPTKRNAVLTWGLLLIGSGLGLFIAYFLDHTVFSRINDDSNYIIYLAMVPIFGGSGLFLAYHIEKKDAAKELER